MGYEGADFPAAVGGEADQHDQDGYKNGGGPGGKGEHMASEKAEIMVDPDAGVEH